MDNPLPQNTRSSITFSVFGRLVLVEQSAEGWQTYYPGADGKRRAADFAIPDFIQNSDLDQYLGDIFHEDATPERSEVIRLVS